MPSSSVGVDAGLSLATSALPCRNSGPLQYQVQFEFHSSDQESSA